MINKKVAAVLTTIGCSTMYLGGCTDDNEDQGADNQDRVEQVWITGENEMSIQLKESSQAGELEDWSISRDDGNEVRAVSLKEDGNVVQLQTEETLLPNRLYTVSVADESQESRVHWRFLDSSYAYEGEELGAVLQEDGSATFKLWAPIAEKASVTLYDKEDAEQVIQADLTMESAENGLWVLTLDKGNTGLANLDGYYYQYELMHYGEERTVLDPYAKSMAPFNSDGHDSVGKAAIVDPASVGPELDFAQIDGFEKRDDAIIWEAHVRDFTSDPTIEGELESRFGTYDAFREKLDYVEELGVTHVQLLPIMKYYFGDEFSTDMREMHYASSGSNYNWGYDPHSYFAPSGMYSVNPSDPDLRIKEVKELIQDIHSRGMGVLLDVVYNHTAQMELFEDLVPNYYHFMDETGNPKESFGGGALASTHTMTQKLMIDSLLYWTEEFKVDGFRFDLMGAHDAKSMEKAYQAVVSKNPDTLMIGEGWRLYDGDHGVAEVPADQDWMKETDSIGVFSDDFRNELRSGFGIEGEPRFTTGGARNIETIFANVKAQPTNFEATSPRDVVQYIEAHDDLTNHDMIALSIRKDPENPVNREEIHRRIRLGNAMVLTSQGTAFLHAGQEYGRTKQWLDQEAEPESDFTYMEDEQGQPFANPYFIHNSYDSTDVVNRFDWTKAEGEGIHNETMIYTKGLIELRRSSDAFRLGSMAAIEEHVALVEAPEMEQEDVAIGYTLKSTDGSGTYTVFINGDRQERTFTVGTDLSSASVLVDREQAGVKPIDDPSGVSFDGDTMVIAPLTVVVIQSES